MTLIEIASLFEARKLSVIEATGLDKDALHIYFGMTLFLTVRLAWRGRGGWIAAWLAVFAMACGGELLDLTAEYSNATIQPDAEHWHDIWNTIFWPTVLLFAGRWLQPPEPAAPSDGLAYSGEYAERRLEQA